MSALVQIYVKLLDEGTEVWRPVAAVHISPGLYQILSDRPEGERW